MQVSLVSSFYDILNEIHLLNLMFCNGLSIFHLRKDLKHKHLAGKKIYTEEKIRSYIESIHECFRDRIIIHSHFHLVKEYGLYGAHFTKKYSYMEYLADKGLKKESKPLNKVGFSVHSTSEILRYANLYDYLLLSPVFDSISNIGYNSKFNLRKLKKFIETEKINSQIVDFGGMNDTKISKVKELGFEGISLLGFIWSEFEEDQDILAAVQRFKKIVNILNATN